MKTATIKSIQYQFKELTNSNISQHEIKKFILPMYNNLKDGDVMRKENNDLVTSVDFRVEKELNNILLHVIQNDNINGPVNLVSPQPITNHMFNQALSKVYHRPAILSIPEILPRLFLGREIANLLYGSSKVFPKKLLDSGYKFAENTPEESIIHYKNYRVK